MRQDLYYGEFFNSSGIPMCLCNGTGEILERNGPFENLFTTAPGLDTPPARVTELCDPDFSDTFLKVLSMAGEGHAGAPYPFQFWYFGKRGARRKADVNITRLPGKEVFLLTFQDVTDKVDAFEELNRRNRDLVGLVKITKLISSSLDPDKIIKVSIDEAARLFGLDRGWLLSYMEDGRTIRPVASLVPGSLPPATVALLNRFISEHLTERFKPAIIESGEGLHLSPSESELLDTLGVRLLAMAPMIVSAKPLGVLCLAATGPGTGITPDRISLLLTLTHQMGVALENARLFREAENNRQRFWSLAENMRDTVCIMDRNLQLIYVNDAVKEMGGYEKDEILGRHVGEFLTGGTLSEQGLGAFVGMINGRDIQPLQLEFKRKDGRTEMTEVSFARMMDGDELIGFQAVIRLVTQKLKWEQEIKRRNDEQTMLLKLARILSSSPDLERVPLRADTGVFTSTATAPRPEESLKQVMTGAVELLRVYLDVDAVAIFSLDPAAGDLVLVAAIESAGVIARYPDGPPARLPLFPAVQRMLASGTPEFWHDLQTLPDGHPVRQALEVFGFRAAAALPIIFGGSGTGFMAILNDRPHEFSESELNLLAAASAQIAVTMMNARHFAEVARHRGDLERLSNRLFSAQEEDRRRIARELHDEAGQSLYALKISLEMMRDKLHANDAEAGQIDEQLRVLAQTIENIRRITYDLRPTLLDDLGLIPAIRWYADGFEKRTGIKIDLAVEMPETKLDGLVEVNIYRIMQEALTNVRRHAAAKNVSVRLFRSDGGLRLEVQDDGAGFSAAQRAVSSGGVGLIGMKERITSLGGSLLIDSLKGRGTNLSVEIPLPDGR